MEIYRDKILGEACAKAYLYEDGNVFIGQASPLNDVHTMHYRRKARYARWSKLPKWCIAAIERGNYVEVEDMEAVKGDRGLYLVIKGKEVSARKEQTYREEKRFDLVEIKDRKRTVKFIDTVCSENTVVGEGYNRAILAHKENIIHSEPVGVLPWNQEEHRLKAIASFLNGRNPLLEENSWVRGEYTPRTDNENFIVEEDEPCRSIDKVDLEAMIAETYLSTRRKAVWSATVYKVVAAYSEEFAYRGHRIIKQEKRTAHLLPSKEEKKVRRILSKELLRTYTESSSGRTGETRTFGGAEHYSESHTYEEWRIAVEEFGTWTYTKCVKYDYDVD